MAEKTPEAVRGGNGLITAGLVIAALVAAGAYLGLRDDGTLTEDQTAALTEPGSDPDVSAPTDTKADRGASAPSDTPEAPAEDEPQSAEVAPPGPSIDEVRVDGGGILVVAGRAQPGSEVEVLIDGTVVTSATVDTSGAFAAVGSVDEARIARTLTLREGTGDDARLADEEIILAPTAPEASSVADASGPGAAAETDTMVEVETSVAPDTAAALETMAELDTVAAPETAAELDTETAPDSAAELDTDVAVSVPQEDSMPVVADASAPTQSDDAGTTSETTTESDLDDTTEVAAAAPVATREPQTEETVDVAVPELFGGAANVATELADKAAPSQDPQVATDETTATQSAEQRDIAVLRSDREGVSLVGTAPATSVELDTIGYSDTGNVELGGRAAVGSVEIRAYLNNRVVAQLPVDANGTWRGEVPDVDAGVYTLRVDAVTDDGTVASRIETPFKREEPAVLAAATAAAADGVVRAVTVQAGDTLWAIARERYGEGLLYVQVFEANRTAIRDPDLIFPGQVFDLPVQQ